MQRSRILFVVLYLTELASSGHHRNKSKGVHFNINAYAPPHLTAHVYLYANGSVPIAPFPNEFANNALNGTHFLKKEMKFTDAQIEIEKQKAIAFWKKEFGVDGNDLGGDGVVLAYQIHPDVNERAFIATQPCPIPSEGFKVLDGGFQLFITNPAGKKVVDPKTGKTITLPFRTNLVYSWLRIDTRLGRRTGMCHQNIHPGGPRRPPATIIMPYQTLRPALWTLESILFDLTIREGNYYGAGVAIGQSAPIIDREAGVIYNRLSDYVTINTPFTKN